MSVLLIAVCNESRADRSSPACAARVSTSPAETVQIWEIIT
jgi:hypothetical protein